MLTIFAMFMVLQLSGPSTITQHAIETQGNHRKQFKNLPQKVVENLQLELNLNKRKSKHFQYNVLISKGEGTRNTNHFEEYFSDNEFEEVEIEHPANYVHS